MKTIHYDTRNIILCFTFFTAFMGCTNHLARLGMEQDYLVVSTEPPQDGRDRGHLIAPTTPPQIASPKATPIPVRPFPENLTPRMLDYIPNGLIVGKIGSGKTSLLNMLSGSSHKTYTEDGESATRVIIREPVQLEEHRGFNLVDSPGIDSDVETYKHSFLLKTALEAMPYNAIFLIVPINIRIQNMEEDLLQTIRLVQEYENNLVLMCSFLDTIIPPDEEIEIDEICGNVHRMAMENNIGHTIMYSKKSNPTALANAMYACMSNKDPITIKVSDEDFFKKFRLWAMKRGVRKVYREFQQKADTLLDEYIKKALELGGEEQHEDINHILAALGHALREELEKNINDFLTKNGLVGTDFETEVAFLEMKKKQLQVSDKFLQETNKLMLWDTLDTSDLRNLIKKCPHCHVFCIKTEGCDGWTRCGRTPKSRDIITNEGKGETPWYKHLVTRVDGKLTVKTEFLTKPRLPRKASRKPRSNKFTWWNLKPTAELDLAGCGRIFTWRNQPFLSGPDLEAVKDMLNDTVGEALKNARTTTQKEVKPKADLEMMGVNDKFKEHRAAYESKINTDITSQMGDPITRKDHKATLQSKSDS